MSKASDNVFPRLLISEGGSTATPAAARVTIYAKADGLLYSKDDAGAETALGGGGGDITTDAAWAAAGDLIVGSGNNTASVLGKGAAGGVLAMGNAAVIWNSGTSFPGSKATGDRYWRTDLGMEFYWDGTRWVTTQLFTAILSPTEAFWPTAGGGSPVIRTASWGTTSLFLVAWHQSWYVVTTNDGSQYWTFTLEDGDIGTDIASFNTAAGSASTWTHTITALNAVFNTYSTIQVTLFKTSTPGTIYYPGFYTYRLIAT